MPDQLLVGIDIGSSKLCSTVALRDRAGGLRYVGHGSTPSAGLRGGAVDDPDALAEAMRRALDETRQLAGVAARDLFLTVSGAQLTASDRSGQCALDASHTVTSGDVMRALPSARSANDVDGRWHTVHRVVREITLDGKPIGDPTGQVGKRLGVTLRDYAIPGALLDDVRAAVEQAGARALAIVPSGVASAAATLTDEERAAGVVLVDIGATTTDIAVYRGGELRELLAVPLGGQHVTDDLAQLLDLPFEDAEHLKQRHGAGDPFAVDDGGIEWGPRGIAALQRLAARGATPPAAIQAIAGARLRLLFERLIEELAGVGVNPRLDASGVVLTGGVARMTGVADVATATLGVTARCAGIRAAAGFPEIPDPAVSASIGLVRYCAARAAGEQPPARPVATRQPPEAALDMEPPAVWLPRPIKAARPRYGAQWQMSRGRGREVLDWMRAFIPVRFGES